MLELRSSVVQGSQSSTCVHCILQNLRLSTPADKVQLKPPLTCLCSCCLCSIVIICFRFATVTVGSENSSRLIFEKLVQKDLHGMLPSVSYYTSASLARLDPSAKKDAPPSGGGVFMHVCHITSLQL